MAVEDSDSNFGTTVRAFAFNGDDTKFRSWEGKTLALASSKGFLLALTRVEAVPGLTVEQYEYGEVEEPVRLATGAPAETAGVAGVTAAPPVRTRPTTSVENRKYLARAAAWTYLVASCTDKAYALIERADGDPFKAWTILQEKYCATDAEENYPELSEAFGKCKLTETKQDPELWFNDLDHLNMRIARINKKYEMDDLQMKSHIMTSMSSGYDSVVVKYRGELAETPLTKLRKEIGLQYKTLLKTTKNKSESALVANVNKHPYKKFKGTCRNCGKIGHKANECRSAKSTADTTDSTKTAGDKSNVTCFNCQEKGHYANKCPKPKKDKADNDMAMFVGLSRIEVDVEDQETLEIVANDSTKFTQDDFFDDWRWGDDSSGNDFDSDDDLGTFTEFFEHDDDDDATMVDVSDTQEPMEFVNVSSIAEEFAGTSALNGTEEWLLDSGATCGVTYDKSKMSNMRSSDKRITIGNGAQVATLGQGTVHLIDNRGNRVTLHDVYYAPKFTKHIVSLRKMIDDDWTLNVADKTEFVLADPVTVSTMRFERHDNDQLYYLTGTRASAENDVEAVHSLTTKPVTIDINIAHGLLGHPDTRTVKAMAVRQNWTLTGTVQPCGSCALAKARAKAVPKTTMTKAKLPGERLFLDISGPFSDSLNSNRYWLRIVDDNTRFCWDSFLPRKSGIHVPLETLIVANKAAGKPCKYLRCDNAGENEAYVQKVCAEHNIVLEMTAPNTPQMNGVVERSFATCKDRAFATMYCARFTLESQGLIWPEAINTMTKLGNTLPRTGDAKDPYSAWHGDDARPNRILDYLQPFGRIAYVTDRTKIKAKADVRATKCVFVGYANDHSGDTYKFYNPTTKHTILSRDVHQWMEWHGRITATDDLALFDELDKLKTDSVILPATTTDIPILSENDGTDLDDLWDLPTTAPAGPEDTGAPVPSAVRPARRNLNPAFGSGAVTRARARASTVTTTDVHRNEDTLEAAVATMTKEDMYMLLVMNALLQSDSKTGVPKNYKDLLKLNDPKWTNSLNGELENFLKRKAWEFLPRSKLPQDRKTLRCRWIFKEKLDGTKKSRTVIRGYEQEPGVDYVESFSPLATNTTIKVVLAISLEQGEIHIDWISIMVDVEAAFLNALVDTDIYIELPEGLLEYLASKGISLVDHIIKLRRAQYGLVQSPRLWMATFAKILIKLGLTQCKTDPCLFILFDADGKLLALVVVYCDDTIITGIRKYVDQIKKGISDAVTISDLGKLVRHLGVDYEFGQDKSGKYVRSSMTDYLDAIVRDFEADVNATVKEHKTPGAAVTPPLRSTPEDKIVLQDLYRSYVGRIMFACGKSEPGISNACRELTCHLNAPNEEHWNALRHLIGYIKNGDYQGLKMRPPKDRRVVAFVDSDYASDRGDRKSISGYLVTIGGCLVSWQSKKQTGVTLSSTESEFVAMSMAATEVKFIVSLLTEIGNHVPLLPSILKEDNTGAIFMAKNTAIGQRTKHVDIRYRFVNDMILSKELWVEHIRSGDNPSDMMTKNLPATLFTKHVAITSEGLLGMLYDPQSTEDVENHCATGTMPCNDATVPVNGNGTVCPGDLVEPGWTTIVAKAKTKNMQRPPRMQGST